SSPRVSAAAQVEPAATDTATTTNRSSATRRHRSPAKTVGREGAGTTCGWAGRGTGRATEAIWCCTLPSGGRHLLAMIRYTLALTNGKECGQLLRWRIREDSHSVLRPQSDSHRVGLTVENVTRNVKNSHKRSERRFSVLSPPRLMKSCRLRD